MGKINPSERLRVFNHLEGVIGNTPIVRLNRVTADLRCAVYVKLEMLNPGGSVKDRIAFAILNAFEASGDLVPGGTVVEATSGNTGVGLAIACALRGYKSVFVLPDKMSQEKVRMLRAFGARVVVTPTAVTPDDPRSYYSVAERIVRETPNAVLANQYHNPANPHSHYESTGPEIWEQTGGQVTDIVCGMGTGGTITGIARYMREKGQEVKIVGVDPEGSILFEAWRQEGNPDGLMASSYLVEGIGEDFIPSTLDLSLVDAVIQVSDAEAFAWTRRLVREEGIFCGGSCGAAMAGAVKYARDLGPDRNVVVILPDSGSRYISKIFDNDWMREHGFSTSEGDQIALAEVVKTSSEGSLIVARINDPLYEVIERMRQHAVSQVPVIDRNGIYQGVVTEVDLLNILIQTESDASDGLTIEDVPLKQVPAVPAGMHFAQALPLITDEKMVVLIDAQQAPIGIMTVMDALTWMSASRNK